MCMDQEPGHGAQRALHMSWAPEDHNSTQLYRLPHGVHCGSDIVKG
jgi:hypothetical protein